MATVEEKVPQIVYIPQSNRTMIVRVTNPGKKPFDLVADIYSDAELKAARAALASKSS